MGLNNAGPKSALFFWTALIRAGVRRAGVKGAIFYSKISKKWRYFTNALFLLTCEKKPTYVLLTMDQWESLVKTSLWT